MREIFRAPIGAVHIKPSIVFGCQRIGLFAFSAFFAVNYSEIGSCLFCADGAGGEEAEHGAVFLAGFG